MSSGLSFVTEKSALQTGGAVLERCLRFPGREGLMKDAV